MHHGIKGQKWGVRRYQNPDGTLTALGRMRLRVEARKDAAELARVKKQSKYGIATRQKPIRDKIKEKSKDPFYKSEFDKALSEREKAKRVAATLAVTYASMKISGLDEYLINNGRYYVNQMKMKFGK